MFPMQKKTVIDIIVILIVAAALGIAWNRQLLYNAWTGQAASPPPPAAATAPASAIPLPVGLMQVKDFFDRNEGVIVDARDAATYAKGRIRGAVSLPIGQAAEKIPAFAEKYPTDTLLILYCNGYGCHDSMQLGQKLIEKGFTQVYAFEGGYPEWKDAGYPVEGTAP
jgi:rhodanese-related sulfurtransferase